MRNVKFNLFLAFPAIIIFIFSSCICQKPVEPDQGRTPERALPTADAGPDQTCRVGNYILLDGTGSRPGEGSQSITYFEWKASNDNPDPIGVSSGIEDSIRAVGFLVPGTYVVYLRVKDEYQWSLADTMEVNVLPRETILFEDPSMEVMVRYQMNNPVSPLLPDSLMTLLRLRSNTWLVTKKISSINGVDLCLDLMSLYLNNHDIQDLSPLRYLSHLCTLSLCDNDNLSDISPLEDCCSLISLDLMFNNISDISALANLIKLKRLMLDDNPLSDINGLSKLTQIEELSLAVTGIKDISSLSGMVQMRRLMIYLNNISDLTPLQNMTELIHLRAMDNQIVDISVLANCSHLDYLWISNNRIQDISSLRNLPLTFLALDGNQIQDILPLMENEHLGNGCFIALGGNPLNEKSINEYIPALRARGVLVDWP